jgi:hypothetical protein
LSGNNSGNCVYEISEVGDAVLVEEVKHYGLCRLSCPVGRPRRRWEDNIKMDLQEVEFGGVDWIELARYRDRWRAVVTAVMNLQVR